MNKRRKRTNAEKQARRAKCQRASDMDKDVLRAIAEIAAAEMLDGNDLSKQPDDAR